MKDKGNMPGIKDVFVNQMENFSGQNDSTKTAFTEKQIDIRDDLGYQIGHGNISKETKFSAISAALDQKSETRTVRNATAEKKLEEGVPDIFEKKVSSGNRVKDKDSVFKNKTGKFLDKGAMLFDVVKPEENESAASNVDDKVITLLTYSGDHIRNELHGIRQEQKLVGKELKREEQKIQADRYFSKSDIQFKDKSKDFIQPFLNRFRIEGKKNDGTDMFLPDKKEKQQVSEIVRQKFSDRKEVSDNQGRRIVPGVKENTKDIFNQSTIKENDSKTSKSAQSYFSDSGHSTGRNENKSNFAEKGGRTEQLKDRKQTLKKEHSKATKKSARIAAVSNMFRAKKIMQNNLGNMSGQSSGNLIKDGAGVLSVITDSLKDFVKYKFKAAIIKIFALIFGYLGNLISSLAPLIIIVVTVLIVVTSFFSIFTDGIETPPGDGYTYSSLSESEIDDIMESLYLEYEDDMNSEQEDLLRYALSKVGCAYDQNYHWSMTENIFDCSSLAYRAYLEIGCDISNQGIYSAAEECRAAINGTHLVTDELKPGDLVFYGGSDNGRYMGVYHVAIYVGKGKMVEARGKNWGVVYGDLRSNNVVAYGRYL